MHLYLAEGKTPTLLLPFFQPEYSEYFLRIFTAFIFLVLIDGTLYILAAYMINPYPANVENKVS
jgi:hypothetical protein